MARIIKLIGIVGLIFLVFGLVLWGLFSQEKSADLYYVTELHVVIGAVCTLLFLFCGGIKLIGAAAARRAAGLGAGVVIYSALFLLVIGLANYLVYRKDPLYYDSTQEKVYTLAPQTKAVLARLAAPVMVRAFYVGAEVDKSVEDLLNRLARTSDNIRWQAVDPEKNPALTEKLGINEKGTLHFSLLDDSAGKEVKIIRHIDEQEIVNALLKLIRGAEKTVYYIAGHGEPELDEGKTNTGALFLKEAVQGENLRMRKLMLAESPSVPDDAAAILVVAAERSLLARERQAITDYLSRGGSAVFLNQPHSASGIAEIVAPLGIKVGNDVIIEKSVQVFQGPSYDAQSIVSSYGHHEITKDFKKSTIFPTATSVRKSDEVPGGCTVVELALSGKESWAEQKVELVFSQEPQAAQDEEDIAGPVPIAAALDCLAARPDAKSGSGAKPAGRVVVIGDADFVNNANIRQLFNRDFFLNILNWTIGEEEGVTIRAKSLRRSVKVLTNRQISLIFLVAGVLIPELVTLAGFVVWWARSSHQPHNLVKR